MTLTRYRVLLLALSLFVLAPVHVQAADGVAGSDAPDVPLNEQVLRVAGDPERPVTLLVTVYRPSGPGPFPLAVMNHGATGDVPPEQQPRYHLTFSAYYFLSRGYAVAMPMMRGYAGSGGKLNKHGCDEVAMGLDAARDIRAVIDYMKQQPSIDGSRIIVAGQSFGGWNTLALGTLHVPDVKGLVSFAGGMRASDCDRQDDSLIDAAGQLGAHTTIPSIWFFGDNDRIFPTSTWHGMYEHYTAAGGQAELVAYGRFMSDSHNMLGSGAALPIWVSKLDTFLAKVGLPNSPIYPQYMPTSNPPSSHYASLDDVKALPYLGDQGVAYYQRFLAKPLPRAIAIGLSGAASFSGGFDPRAQALKACQQRTRNCQLYAVDNDVVWVRSTPEPPPTRFAALDDTKAVPYLDDRGRAAYQKFLTMPRPRAFAIAPDGRWGGGALGPDPLAYVLDTCNKGHHDCTLYAVDGDVVWPGTALSKER